MFSRNKLKRKYEDFLFENNWKKVKFNKSLKEFDFIDYTAKEDCGSTTEAFYVKNPSITEDPLLLPTKDQNLVQIDNRSYNEKYYQDNAFEFERTDMNYIQNDLLVDSPKRTFNKGSLNERNRKNSEHHLGNEKAVILQGEITPFAQRSTSCLPSVSYQSSLTGESLVKHRPHKSGMKIQDTIHSPVPAEMIVPFKFDTEEDDIDSILNSSFNKMCNNDATQNTGQYIDNVCFREPIAERDPEPSFCPRIANIFTTNKESFESGLLFDDESVVIKENSTGLNNFAEPPLSQPTYYNSCHVCSVSFNSEIDWLSHIESLQHQNSFVSFKKTLGIPLSFEKETSSPKAKKKSRKNTSEFLHLGNEADTFEPVPYIPLNLLKRRVVMCGAFEFSQKVSDANSHNCHCKIRQNNRKRAISHLQSELETSENDLMNKSGELPIIFIPYQVRVTSSTSIEPKLVLMYLPHFDTSSSHAFMKESWSLPSDAWIGDVEGPVKENLNVVFNSENRKPSPEVSVSRVLAPVNIEHPPLNLNKPKTDPPSSSSDKHYLSDIGISSIPQHEFSSNADSVSETEKSFMNKLGLQCVASLCKNSEEKNQTKLISKPSVEAGEKSVLMNTQVTKEIDIKFSSVSTHLKNVCDISSKADQVNDSVCESLNEEKSSKTAEFKNFSGETLFPWKNVPSNKKDAQKPSEKQSLSSIVVETSEKQSLSSIVVESPDKKESGVETHLQYTSTGEKLKTQLLKISIKVLKEEGVEIKQPQSTEELTSCPEGERQAPNEKYSKCLSNTQNVDQSIESISNKYVLSLKNLCSKLEQGTNDGVEAKVMNEPSHTNLGQSVQMAGSCRSSSPKDETMVSVSDGKEYEKVTESNSDYESLDDSCDKSEFGEEVKNTDCDSINLPEPEDISMESSPKNEMSDYIKLLNEEVHDSYSHCSSTDHKDQISSPKSGEHSNITELLTSFTTSSHIVHLGCQRKLIYSSKSAKVLPEKYPRVLKKRDNLANSQNNPRKRKRKKKKDELKRRKTALQYFKGSYKSDSSSEVDNESTPPISCLSWRESCQKSISKTVVQSESSSLNENMSENSINLTDLDATSDVGEETNDAYSKFLVGFL